MNRTSRTGRTGRSDRGRRAERFGRGAERLCRLALALHGYRVLATRYRSPAGEIDIVARRGSVLAVIEVKARDEAADALAAVGPRQRARLERAATAFLARRPDLAELAVRFDLMVVAPWRWPWHLQDAWRPEPWPGSERS